MTTQQFRRGDHVRVADDLGPHMRHFDAGGEAIVLGSYADKYGGSDARARSIYTLHLKGRGAAAWYDAEQLTLIAAGRADLLQTWEDAAAAEAKQRADLDWIFAHGADVLAAPHGATIAALAACFGLTDLWGSRGEGVTYAANAHGTLALARPFLLAGDKAGWLAACADVSPPPAPRPPGDG